MQFLHYTGQDFGLFPEVKAAVVRDHTHTKKPAMGTGTLLHMETPLLHGAVRGSACTACPTQLLKGKDKLKDKIREGKKCFGCFWFCFCFWFCVCVFFF